MIRFIVQNTNYITHKRITHINIYIYIYGQYIFVTNQQQNNLFILRVVIILS